MGMTVRVDKLNENKTHINLSLLYANYFSSATLSDIFTRQKPLVVQVNFDKLLDNNRFFNDDKTPRTDTFLHNTYYALYRYLYTVYTNAYIIFVQYVSGVCRQIEYM